MQVDLPRPGEGMSEDGEFRARHDAGHRSSMMRRQRVEGSMPGSGRRGISSVRLAVGALVGSLVLAAAMFWAGSQIHGGGRALPSHIHEPIVTVPLAHRLLRDTLQVNGSVVLPGAWEIRTLQPQLTGDAQPLITRLPIRRGSVVTTGSLLAEVAGQPIFAMEGSVPMYRSLALRSRGADVTQLQNNLQRLGFTIADQLGYFGGSTEDAVARLFEEYGYAAPVRTDLVAAEKTGRRKKARSSSSVFVPEASLVYIPHLPAVVTSVQAHIGNSLPSSLGTVAAGTPVVRVSVDPTQLPTVRRGMAAMLSWPGGHAHGRVNTVPPASTSSSKDDSITVSFAHDADIPPLGTQLSVMIVRASSHHSVWVVPFSAVVTAPDGGSALEILAGRRREHVGVSLGLSVGGYVVVKPAAGARLRTGERTLVGS
jgi:hypothetical protein